MCSRDYLRRISKLATPAMLLVALWGCARPQGALFSNISPARVWPAPPDPPRIQWVGTIAGSADLKAARSMTQAMDAALRGPRPPIRFSSPTDIAVLSPDVVAVADGQGSAVHIMHLHDRSHQVIYGDDSARFGAPMGLTWVQRQLFVTDAQRHEVFVLDAQGTIQTRFGADVLSRPVGITYMPGRHEIFVVDGGAHRIAVFDLTGRWLRFLGQRGDQPGQFNFPTYISSAPNRLLVADSGNARVQVIDALGQSLCVIGKRGDAAGDFSLPKGVGWDPDGHIFVVDAHFENMQIFNETGELLLAVGEEGSHAGEFWLPAGLTIDDQDRIWIADAGNRRLQVFAYLRTLTPSDG